MREDTYPNHIHITHDGVEWAHALGLKCKDDTLGYRGLRADRVCPFREGTSHRVCWYAGWRGKPVPYAIVS